MQKQTLPVDDLIGAAVLAPSGHNAQPWKFRVEGQTIRILPDFARRLSVVDPNDRALFISLGCATENLVIAAEALGYRAAVRYLGNSPADFEVCIELTAGQGVKTDDLYSAIPKRHTNRKRYDGHPIPREQLKALEELTYEEGVGITLVTENEDRKEVENLVLRGDHVQFSDPKFKKELVDWVRFNRREQKKFLDGLASEATGNPSVPRWVGSLIVNRTTPESQSAKDERLLRSSSALAIVWSKGDSIEDWIRSGRAFEKFALKATQLGIQHAYMNQAVEVLETRVHLRNLPLLSGRWPQLVIRLGYARPAPQSMRRPISDVSQYH